MPQNIQSPLEGIRILDWTIWQQGPVAGVMLGDLGAEVIKIEQRGVGDPGRGMASVAGKATGVAGRNSYFEANNRNKKSIAIDLTKSKGKDLVYRLVEKSDVFLQNFRKGVASRLGMDYGTLSRLNSQLVYASASGWGPEGPDAAKPSFDYTGLARSGLMCMVGEPEMPPLGVRGGIADQLGAIMTAYGVVTALLARERSGVGQEVDASLLGSMIWLQGNTISMKLMAGSEGPRLSRTRPNNPLWNHYWCKDDKWIVLANLQPDRHWPALCRALGIEHLAQDARFEMMAARKEHSGELVEIMDAVFATRTRAEWRAALAEASSDLVFESVQTIPEVIADEQALVNGYVQDFDHPAWGPIKVVGPPVRLSKTPAAVRSEAPEFGQHTEEILSDVLGCSWEEIAALQSEEVI